MIRVCFEIGEIDSFNKSRYKFRWSKSISDPKFTKYNIEVTTNKSRYLNNTSNEWWCAQKKNNLLQVVKPDES